MQSKITSYYNRSGGKKNGGKTNDKQPINFCKRGISRHSRLQNLLIKHIHKTSDLQQTLQQSAVTSLLTKLNNVVANHCKKEYRCYVFKEVTFCYNRTKRCDVVLYIPDAQLLFLVELKTTSSRRLYEGPVNPLWKKQISCTFHQAVMTLSRSLPSTKDLHVYSLLMTRLYHVNRSKWKYNEDTTRITHKYTIQSTPSVNWFKTNSMN